MVTPFEGLTRPRAAAASGELAALCRHHGIEQYSEHVGQVAAWMTEFLDRPAT